MHSSRMICLSCRRQLVAAAVPRARVSRLPQWQAGLSIKWTSSTTQSSTRSSADDFIPSLDAPHSNNDIDYDVDLGIDINEPWATGDDATNAHEATSKEPDRFRTMSRVSTFRKTLAPPHKNSMELFEKIIRRQVAQDKRATATAKRRDLSPEAVEFYADLAKLRPMIKEQKIEDCLEFFLTKLWAKGPFERRTRLLRQKGAYLMGKVAEAKMADFDNTSLPSISQITQYYHEMDSLGSTRWSNMMLGLIKAILTKSAVRTEYESDEAYATAKRRKEELVDDLVDSWIIFHRNRMSADSSTLQSSEEAEFRLPSIDPNKLQYFAWRQNYRGALSCIFPDWVGQIRDIPAVAIATFVLLVDDDHSTASARQKAKPLLVPIGHVVSACPIGQSDITEMLEPHPSVLLYVLKQWSTVIQRLHRTKGSGRELEHRKETSSTMDISTKSLPAYEKSIIARIRYAIGMSDVLTLEAIWREFWGPGGMRKRSATPKDQAKALNYFIMAFTALQKPNRAIDTWDAMISLGLSPTLETWSSMIEGCRKGRNAAGIERVWGKLVASGLPLDEAVWSSRIMGLMEAGEPDAGIRALHDMLRMSQLPGGVPLNVKAVNAAVTGLFRLNAKSAAKQVLVWASQHGIEPDVFTYNILLGPLVAEGRAAEIQSTLKLMSDSNIKPNAATYTILLEGLLHTTHDLPPIQQRLSVEKLLADMARDGVVANLENLGRMLHLVLRNGKHTENHTEGAVGAIFRHMDRNKMTPSPHILTILVDHFFARNPPAIKDIELLLQTYNHSLVDRVFWERVIRGYALVGSTDRAFAWFEKTYFTSFIITLDTLEILLRALVKDNNMSAAARVVDDVKQHRGASVGATNNSAKFLAQRTSWDRYWKHGFWGYAMDCGLLGAAEWRAMAAPQGIAQVSDVPIPSVADA